MSRNRTAIQQLVHCTLGRRMTECVSRNADIGPRYCSTALPADQHLGSKVFQGRALPASVRIFEVGPRDGLQNEPVTVPTESKIRLIDMLSATGLKHIEATSFVSPKWVPQLGDASAVMAGIKRHPGVTYPVLTPNMKGLEGALAAGATEVCVFAAATESFSRKNLNCGVSESLERFAELTAAARLAGLRVRGYVSVAAGCPYEGAVDPKAAADVASALLSAGCYEVSMGDTIGIATPATITALFEACLQVAPAHCWSAHLHDTYGCALANILAVMQLGIRSIDSSIAGLGGCPYAPGATGNVATEDVVYMLHGMGVHTGVDMERLLDVTEYVTTVLGRPPASRVARALLSQRASRSKRVSATAAADVAPCLTTRL